MVQYMICLPLNWLWCVVVVWYGMGLAHDDNVFMALDLIET